MNKKAKIIIILIAVFLVAVLFFIQRLPIIPQITNDERIDKIIFDHTGRLREVFGSSVLGEGSLINLVHIIKEESDYRISCQFGPAYESANLNKFYPEEIVSMGQIKDCTVETARIIDEAINSPEKDCRVPMETIGVFSSFTDYYLVALDIKEHKITQEWIDRAKGKRCFEPLESLLGENIAVEFIVVIIDLEGNRFFY